MEFVAPPHGTPLSPDQWYTHPLAIPPVNDKPQYQGRLGDIYDNVPSLCIGARPLRVCRDWRDPKSGRMAYTARYEDDADAEPPFNWLEGEDVVVTCKRGLAVLLTQDCEIEKPRAVFAFALIRVIDDSVAPQAINQMRSRQKYRSFYLAPQADPAFPAAYVDFGRITSIERDAVRPEDRRLSMSDDVRDCMQMDYIDFRALDRRDDD
jgi:hypothetical protein